MEQQFTPNLQDCASLFKKGADWYPFCLGGGTGRGVWEGGGEGGPPQK